MADYTPTFEPALSGLTPDQLLEEASVCRKLAAIRGKNRRTFSRRADLFERETEERWLASGPPWAAVFTDGNIGAPGSKRAFQSFVGTGR